MEPGPRVFVSDKDDSPHLVAKRSAAEFYFARAETDVWAPPQVIARLKHDLESARGGGGSRSRRSPRLRLSRAQGYYLASFPRKPTNRNADESRETRTHA
jgi:hypothetical protein